MDRSLGSWSRNWLVPFVLLSMQHRVLSGHELLEKLTDLGFGETRPGEVYRTLRLLEKEGMTYSEEGELDYLFSRRRYGLTSEGEAYLEFLAHSLELYRKEIELFFSAYEVSALHGVLRS